MGSRYRHKKHRGHNPKWLARTVLPGSIFGKVRKNPRRKSSRSRVENRQLKMKIEPQSSIIPCRDCGKDFLSESITIFGRAVITQRACDPCVEQYDDREAKVRSDQHAANRIDHWESLCPPVYRDNDPDRLPESAKSIMAHVMRWSDDGSGRGLGIIGASRAGKTRLIWALLKGLYGSNPMIDLMPLRGGQLARAISGQWDQGEAGISAKRTLARAASCRLLFVDDIAKVVGTERITMELFDLLEERSANMRPTIWTMNEDRDNVSRRLGLATVGRLEEFSTVLRTQKS